MPFVFSHYEVNGLRLEGSEQNIEILSDTEIIAFYIEESTPPPTETNIVPVLVVIGLVSQLGKQ